MTGWPAGWSRGLALVLIGSALVTGCTPTRSREAFCHTLAEEKQRYLDKHSDRLAQIGEAGHSDLSPLFTALGASDEAFEDAVAVFDKLTRVAPEEIAPDVEAVRDSLERQRDALRGLTDKPLGALIGSLTSGLSSLDSWERVSTYIEQNCDAGAR